MRKCLIFLFLTASLAFAEDACRLNPEVQVKFIDSTIWSGHYSYPYGGFVIIADTMSETLTDGYKCFKGRIEGETAFIDSNVFLYYEGFREKILYIFATSTATHGLGDVFRDEFLHWQQCGLLNMTYEEADSLIEPMVRALNKPFNSEIWTNLQFHTSWAIASDLPVPYTYPQLVRDWAKKACAKAPIAQVQKNGAAGIVLENGLAHIPERLMGQKYFIFDMNGRAIQAGIAKETIRMPLYPAILKVGNEKPFLSKF